MKQFWLCPWEIHDGSVGFRIIVRIDFIVHNESGIRESQYYDLQIMRQNVAAIKASWQNVLKAISLKAFCNTYKVIY